MTLYCANAVDRALQPVRVGQQTDLDKDSFEVDAPDLIAVAILVEQPVDLVAVAGRVGGRRHPAAREVVCTA